MIGAKAQSLIDLQTTTPGHVPDFIVVPFSDCIEDYTSLQKAIIKEVSSQITQAKLNEKKLTQLANTVTVNKNKVKQLIQNSPASKWEKISVRTSAAEEDGTEHSFAGQYISFVDVQNNLELIIENIRKCFCSMFAPRVVSYAIHRNVPKLSIEGSVVLQKMFYGTMSGVCFSENGAGAMRIEAVNSWKNTVVEGADTKTYIVKKADTIDDTIPPEITRLITLIRKIEKKFDTPVDVEWSSTASSVAILQARPITTNITDYSMTWDGTNISENYPNTTLPLTYSFIRTLYGRVYPSFLSLMGIEQSVLDARKHVFHNMLGYINGRVYYRIDNWYALVDMIPGKNNRQHFEAMLRPVKNKQKSKTRTKLNFSILILGARLVWLILTSQVLSRRFSREFTQTFDRYNALRWDDMNAASVANTLSVARDDLLRQWRIPILNDVRVMILHGIVKKRYFSTQSNEAYLAFLSGLTEQASVKPLLALRHLGVKLHDHMKKHGIKTPNELIKSDTWSDISAEVQHYTTTFGGRTPDELQLENPRLSEDTVGVVTLALASREAKEPTRTHKYRVNMLRQPLLYFLRINLKQAIDNRERFRFNRAQVFGVARQAYLSIGKQLTHAGVIATQSDIFWLTEQEIDEVVQGHAWEYNLQPTISRRKKQHTTYDDKSYPLHVTGSGAIAPKNIHYNKAQKTTLTSDLNGSGVAPGRVTAPAVVVNEFSEDIDVNGKILVVKHIDPGWTLLLLRCAGVITERGNALSHVAIVSREIGIPAIVGVENATNAITSGKTITLDGVTGEVTK